MWLMRFLVCERFSTLLAEDRRGCTMIGFTMFFNEIEIYKNNPQTLHGNGSGWPWAASLWSPTVLASENSFSHISQLCFNWIFLWHVRLCFLSWMLSRHLYSHWSQGISNWSLICISTFKVLCSTCIWIFNSSWLFVSWWQSSHLNLGFKWHFNIWVDLVVPIFWFVTARICHKWSED